MNKKYPYIAFFFLLLAALAIGGCAGGTSNQSSAGLTDAYLASEANRGEMTEFNNELFSKAQLNSDPGEYLLSPGDLLQITVFETSDLNTKVRVSSRGYVTLPLIGQVQVTNLTARDAENKIEELYRGTYLKDPHVSIFIEENFSQKITVWGEVSNPGAYDYQARQRLLDVLALTGGLTDAAGTTAQIRRTDEQGESGLLVIDLEKLVKEGRTELNVEIKSGDVILIPKGGQFYAEGAVRKPGSYRIKNQMILMEALLAAGGLAPYADKSTVTLIRYDEDGQRTMMEVDLKDFKSQEIPIQDRDVIIAKSSAWGKMLQGTGINIGIPGFGVGYKDPEK